MAKRPVVEVQNVNHPGQRRKVDAAMYEAMKRAYLAVLPARPPGLTTVEIQERLPARLPTTLYPGGAKAGWWSKTVQLHLEAKGIVAREKCRPIRLHRAPARSTASHVDVDSVLGWLERSGTKRGRDGMARYGIPSTRAFGVGVARPRRTRSDSAKTTRSPRRCGSRGGTKLAC